MPIWVKCILMLWVVFLFMQIWASIYKRELQIELFRAKLTNYKTRLSWCLYVYGITFVLCIFSIIPLAIWFIFLRG